MKFKMKTALVVMVLSVFVAACSADQPSVSVNPDNSQTKPDIAAYLKAFSEADSTEFREGMYQRLSEIKTSEYIAFLASLRDRVMSAPTDRNVSDYFVAQDMFRESSEFFNHSEELVADYKMSQSEIIAAEKRVIQKAVSAHTPVDYDYLHHLYFELSANGGSTRENSLEYIAAKEIVMTDWRSQAVARQNFSI